MSDDLQLQRPALSFTAAAIDHVHIRRSKEGTATDSEIGFSWSMESGSFSATMTIADIIASGAWTAQDAASFSSLVKSAAKAAALANGASLA